MCNGKVWSTNLYSLFFFKVPQVGETRWWLYFLGHGTPLSSIQVTLSLVLLFFKMIDLVLALSSNAFILAPKPLTYCTVCVCFWKFSVGFCARVLMWTIIYCLQLYCYIKFHCASLNVNIELHPCCLVLLLKLHTFALYTYIVFYFFIPN